MKIEEEKKDGCPFRQAHPYIDGEPSSYCAEGDCLYDPRDETNCGIFSMYLNINKK